MKASFDIAAATYDQSFTHTLIGKLQRKAVYKSMSSHLLSVKNIFEINCGTGEDALWFASQNLEVLATDVSEKMIAIGKAKNQYQNLTFSTLDITNLSSFHQEKKYDLLFSNFGGLNCLSPEELSLFFETAPIFFKEKGKMALVLMPKNTIWEQFYFLIKGKWSNAFRRKKKIAFANVDGEKVPTYYYNPKEIVHLTRGSFDCIEYKPIGLFIPPSYLEPFFKNKKRFLQFLNLLEMQIRNFSFLSKYADHYIIILQKK
ncbi:Methylase [Flavobacterium sp. 9AF]|uniref:class I SAM-dependent methyltransferase n=1 Tax=Flavobacterium sp. 9AF TaxID=2653142 RepID=UPI0012F12241|nr:class I SAM-dependent methyltransferase [Flavobacterium sp. 9AF]VXC18903.1 Methylase [Flavobacterium sp. 9AF]